MKIPVLCLVACLVAAPGCKRHTSVYARPGDDPHDTDTLYALYRQILTDSDPVFIWGRTACEISAMMDRLGPDVASRRIDAALDTVYTRAERRKRNQIDVRLGNREYPVDSIGCAELIQNKERAKAKVDTTHKPDRTIR